MIKKGNKQFIILLSAALFVMGTVGCNKKETPEPQPQQPVKHGVKPPPPIQKQQTSAKVVPNAGQLTNSTVRKDPFKPFIVETKPAKPIFAKRSSRGLLPIQSYEVNQFRVLGIIAGLKENSALVNDPAGKAYVVKPGMEIGKNGGRISKISTNTIEIVEKYRENNGRMKKRTVRLTLPRKE